VFSFAAIELLRIDSFKTGMLLLSGLFFYDVFWVFGNFLIFILGTDVMVTVAKSLDVPIKMLWPKNIWEIIDAGIVKTPPDTKFSLLGLGDIVLPGIFIALCLRYDYFRYLSTPAGKKNPLSSSYPRPYFQYCFLSYVLGLITTMTVMHIFQASQV
jgi:minor histocompatibility antigen H13